MTERMSVGFAVFNLHVNGARPKAKEIFIRQFGQDKWDEIIAPLERDGIMKILDLDLTPETAFYISTITLIVNGDLDVPQPDPLPDPDLPMPPPPPLPPLTAVAKPFPVAGPDELVLLMSRQDENGNDLVTRLAGMIHNLAASRPKFPGQEARHPAEIERYLRYGR